MTGQELDDIEARANAATEGPWIPKHIKVAYLATGEVEHQVRSRANGKTVAAIRFKSQGAEIGGDIEDYDLAFIAHARTDVPALIAVVRRLTTELAWRDKATSYCCLPCDWFGNEVAYAEHMQLKHAGTAP